ncbi:FkbM family methyltransferase [Gluconacetobacter azotocaptans]|uniref:FkbM family methyltransferase n=1 Tax=Gluconacetobacter azotocaptans TaxID=142834 RepID=A0A7W4JW17_9PROT|nr:FkbM family methyltransferase [Gluconacetobacter azotocaptans]MBB2191919.1 FkbM family methyltransferase [Gluconacetobacter azotocaptans]
MMDNTSIAYSYHGERIEEYFKNKTGKFERISKILSSQKIFFVYFTNRCGSTFFCAEASALGYCGEPNAHLNYEYFNSDAVIEFCDAENIGSLSDYVSAIEKRYRSSLGTFMVKASLDQLAWLFRVGIATAFPDRIFVQSVRRDLLEQSVSMMIARQTGRWTSLHPDSAVAPELDIAQAIDFMHYVAKINADSDLLFNMLGITPYRMVYEDMLAAPVSIRRMLEHSTGIMARRNGCRSLPLSRQATALNKAWVEQIRVALLEKHSFPVGLSSVDGILPKIIDRESVANGLPIEDREVSLAQRKAQRLKDIDTRYGSLRIPAAEEDLIGRFLAHYGEWAWDEVSFIASVLPDDARILDIGACFGTFGLGVSMLRKVSYVCFVDANPAVIPFLTHNVTHNALAPYAIREHLMGTAGIEVAPAHGEPGNIGATSFTPDVSAQTAQPTAPPVKELSDLWQEEGPFDLIKIDAEGMELSILDSHARLLSQGQVTLWLECNEDAQSLALCERLLSWDMEIFYFAFPSHNPDNFRQATSPVFPFAYEAGLLAAPRRQPVLGEELRAHNCVLRSIRSVAELREALWATPRWGMAEWEGKDVTAVAALAGHYMRAEQFETFLRPGWRNGELIGNRITALEDSARHALREAHDQNVAQQHALDDLSARCQDLTGRLDREQAAMIETQAHAQELAAGLAFEKNATATAEARAQELAAGLALEQAANVAARARNQKLIDELAHYGPALAAAQAQIQRLERQLAVTTANIFDQIAEAGQHLESTASDELRNKEAQLVQMQSLVEHYSDRVIFLQNADQQLQKRIRDIEISTIWRVTSPMRRVVERHPLIHKVARSGRRIAAGIRNKYFKA